MVCALAFAAAAALAPPSVMAQQSGLNVEGTEILPQFLRPSGALFGFNLYSGGRRVGGGLIEVQHEPELPTEEGECIDVLDGDFLFRVGWFQFTHGRVVGGQICGTDDPNIFDVYLELETSKGECLEFIGELDHTPLTRRPPRLPKVYGVLQECED
jgi:hypothetical protein